jgi:mannose-6-phosphate isomerase
MDCDPGAQMIHSLKPGVDAARLRQAAAAGDMEDCIRRVAIQPGDFIDIPAGTVHATLAGSLLCEVQQSSNTTYRLWDWNRLPPRELHIGQACAVADYNPDPAQAGRFNVNALSAGQWHTLVRNEFFDVRTIHWTAGQTASIARPNAHGLILNVVAGGGALEAAGHTEALRCGQTWFLPAGVNAWTARAGENGLRLLASESLEMN